MLDRPAPGSDRLFGICFLVRVQHQIDRGIANLITDLHDRGLDQDVVVYVGGEMGRTPKVGQSTGNGSKPDGRDHWVRAGFGLFADDTASGLFIAVLLAVGLGVLVLGLRGDTRVTPSILRGTTILVVGLYVVRLLDGWSFVPGALAVAPVAVEAVPGS